MLLNRLLAELRTQRKNSRTNVRTLHGAPHHCTTLTSNNLNLCFVILVIGQPQVPLRLPCYDFAAVLNTGVTCSKRHGFVHLINKESSEAKSHYQHNVMDTSQHVSASANFTAWRAVCTRIRIIFTHHADMRLLAILPHVPVLQSTIRTKMDFEKDLLKLTLLHLIVSTL